MTFSEVEEARKRFCKEKRAIWKRASVRFAIFMALIVFGCVCSIMMRPDFEMTPSILMGYILILGAFVVTFVILTTAMTDASKEKTAYEKAYRAYFIERVMNAMFTDLHYQHDEEMPKEEFLGMFEVKTADPYISNDFTKGRYKNVSFSQADVYIGRESKVADGSYDVFRGRFMIFKLPKNFSSRLLVMGKGATSKQAGATLRIIHYDKFKKIETESNEFNRRFTLKAEDGFEMFYLLDPAMITNMERIADVYKDKVMFCFYENKLLVGINNGKDSFEPPRQSINKPLDEKAEFFRNLADIKVITDFVDGLKLDR